MSRRVDEARLIAGSDGVHEVWVTVNSHDLIVSTIAGHWGPNPPSDPLHDPAIDGAWVRTWVRSAKVRHGRGQRDVWSEHHTSEEAARVAPLFDNAGRRVIR